MAEWLGRRTWDLEIPRSSPALTSCWICFRFNCSAAHSQSQLICPCQLGFVTCYVKFNGLFHWPWKAPEGRGQSDIHDISFLCSIRKDEDLMFICCWNAHNKLRGKFGGLHGIAVHVNWQVAARYPGHAKPWSYEWWSSPFVSFPSDRSSIQHSLSELPNWISFLSFQVHPSVERQSHPWLSEAHQLHYFLPELKYSRFQT